MLDVTAWPIERVRTCLSVRSCRKCGTGTTQRADLTYIRPAKTNKRIGMNGLSCPGRYTHLALQPQHWLLTSWTSLQGLHQIPEGDVSVEKVCMSCYTVEVFHKCLIMFSLFSFYLLFQEVHTWKRAWENVSEVRVSSNPAHVDSYLDCFASGCFGAKHVLLKNFAFLISFLMSFSKVCTVPKVPSELTAVLWHLCLSAHAHVRTSASPLRLPVWFHRS